MDTKDLAKPITPRWRVQSFNKYKPQATCVGYIDARDVMNLLDEVVGPNNWQDKYEFVGTKLIAGIGIRVKTSDNEFIWVWKFDTGTSGSIENEKSIFSDAFKRAAVKWGIGRFLYDLPLQYVKADKKKAENVWPNPVDEFGKEIWDLTTYINDRNKAPKTNQTLSVGKCTKCGAANVIHPTTKGIVCGAQCWDKK